MLAPAPLFVHLVTPIVSSKLCPVIPRTRRFVPASESKPPKKEPRLIPKNSRAPPETADSILDSCDWRRSILGKRCSIIAPSQSQMPPCNSAGAGQHESILGRHPCHRLNSVEPARARCRCESGLRNARNPPRTVPKMADFYRLPLARVPAQRPCLLYTS